MITAKNGCLTCRQGGINWQKKEMKDEPRGSEEAGDAGAVDKANAGAVPRRGSDVGTSPLLGRKTEEA